MFCHMAVRIGSGSITGTEQEMAAVIDTAIESGVNYFDMVSYAKKLPTSTKS